MTTYISNDKLASLANPETLRWAATCSGEPGLAVQLGWTTAVAASITDCQHDEGLDTFDLLKGMVARVEASTQPVIIASREEAIEVLEDVTQYVKDAFSRWED